MDFKDFGFEESLLDGINAMNYLVATPIQEQVIPKIMAGKDIIGSAQTGTGKTAAFLLPIIHDIITKQYSEEDIHALIVVPTRELAIQIEQNMEAFSFFTPISSIAVYGGTDGFSFEQEKRALSSGVDIVVCTPGKLISHLSFDYVKIKHLKYLILDEADRMLDMGFSDDIMRIISYLPPNRQTLLFSATMPPKIREPGLKILKNPEQVSISISKPAEKIKQSAYIIYEHQKIPILKHLLTQLDFKRIVLFCSRKDIVKKLSRELNRAHIYNDEIHSDLEQSVREQVLLKFKNGNCKIIVATDVISRGIDIDNIDLVINYDVPNDGEDYVHRIGRTARAENDGNAITFVNEQDQLKLKRIEDLIGYAILKNEVPSEYGSTPSYHPIASTKKKYHHNKNKFRKKKQPPKSS